MPELSKEAVALLQYLLPGFMVLWVYYGLSPHPKPSHYEGIVQALIMSVIVKACVYLDKMMLETLGQYISFGPWNAQSELIWSVISAVCIGLSGVIVFHSKGFALFLKRFDFSSRVGHPSEWYTAIYDRNCYVVLQMKDRRRLMGWPLVMPTDPKNGQFLLTNAAWVPSEINDATIPLHGLEGIIVDMSDVQWVEFVAKPKD